MQTTDGKLNVNQVWKTVTTDYLNLVPMTWSHCWIVEVCNKWNGSTELIDFIAADVQNFPVLLLLITWKQKTVTLRRHKNLIRNIRLLSVHVYILRNDSVDNIFQFSLHMLCILLEWCEFQMFQTFNSRDILCNFLNIEFDNSSMSSVFSSMNLPIFQTFQCCSHSLVSVQMISICSTSYKNERKLNWKLSYHNTHSLITERCSSHNSAQGMRRKTKFLLLKTRGRPKKTLTPINEYYLPLYINFYRWV